MISYLATTQHGEWLTFIHPDLEADETYDLQAHLDRQAIKNLRTLGHEVTADQITWKRGSVSYRDPLE